jgi:hypothetical protein
MDPGFHDYFVGFDAGVELGEAAEGDHGEPGNQRQQANSGCRRIGVDLTAQFQQIRDVNIDPDGGFGNFLTRPAEPFCDDLACATNRDPRRRARIGTEALRMASSTSRRMMRPPACNARKPGRVASDVRFCVNLGMAPGCCLSSSCRLATQSCGSYFSCSRFSFWRRTRRGRRAPSSTSTAVTPPTKQATPAPRSLGDHS